MATALYSGVSMNVLVIDLGVGNIRSLTSALAYLGAPHFVSDDPAALGSATHAILPGVGAFDPAMKMLVERSLVGALHAYANQEKRPLLGVCLGMQLLCDGSEEGCLPGLGLMRGRFVKLASHPGSHQKVPHVGFSRVYGYSEAQLFRGLGPQSYFYFTHSYALPTMGAACNTALCDHARPFVAGFQQENICGVQFHPEKSQSAGLRLIGNFLESVQ
jgi:glutamine amidotransferase